MVGVEMVLFRRAELVAAETYVVSGLLRGRSGTTWAMASHTAGERFVLLSTTGIRRVAMQQSQTGVPLALKAVTAGRTLASVDPVAFTPRAVSQICHAPHHLRAVRLPGGDLRILWARATRLSCNALAGIVPLGEAAETWRVELRDHATGALLRTLTPGATQATWTAAEQSADGAAGGDQVDVRVAQVSAALGPGYWAAITTTL